jgi:hypothetical protein
MIVSDGFIIMYAKDDKAYPVVISKEELEYARILINMAFESKTIKVIDTPMGDIVNYKDIK